jgi:hypothetical protein
MSSSPVFIGVRVTRSLVLCVYFVDHCLSCCPVFVAIVLSVLSDLRVLINPLVSLFYFGLNIDIF